MQAEKWIDKAKIANGWATDYKASKELGCKPATIYQYRSLGGTLDELMCVKVANSLG
jgi:hypothetical protein